MQQNRKDGESHRRLRPSANVEAEKPDVRQAVRYERGMSRARRNNGAAVPGGIRDLVPPAGRGRRPAAATAGDLIHLARHASMPRMPSGEA